MYETKLKGHDGIAVYKSAFVGGLHRYMHLKLSKGFYNTLCYFKCVLYYLYSIVFSKYCEI